MEHISPAEHDLFVRALRLLGERVLEKRGLEGDLDPNLPKQEELGPAEAAQYTSAGKGV